METLITSQPSSSASENVIVGYEFQPTVTKDIDFLALYVPSNAIFDVTQNHEVAVLTGGAIVAQATILVSGPSETSPEGFKILKTFLSPRVTVNANSVYTIQAKFPMTSDGYIISNQFTVESTSSITRGFRFTNVLNFISNIDSTSLTGTVGASLYIGPHVHFSTAQPLCLCHAGFTGDVCETDIDEVNRKNMTVPAFLSVSDPFSSSTTL